MLRNPWVRALLILLLAGVIGVFDATPSDGLPNLLRRTCSPAEKDDAATTRWFKDRCVNLGLDLAGGTQLRYRIDLGQIPLGQQDAIVDGIRDVMDKRVNALGVSEPIVTPSKLNGQNYITVELPGTRDIQEAIAKVGKVVRLEFKEQRQTLTEAEIKEDADFNAGKKALAEKTAERAKSEEFSTLLAELNETNPYSRGGTFENKKQEELYEDQKKLIFEELQPGQVSGMHEVRMTMQTGEVTEEVTTGYSVVKLLDRKDVTETKRTPAKASVTQLLVKYVGATDTPTTITRSKDDARKLAEELLGKARAGEDFSALITANSDDTTKDANKGVFTDIAFGEADTANNGFKDPAHNQALIDGKVGEFLGPVDTAYGFFVIRTDAKTEAKDESTTVQEASFQEIFFTARVPSDWRSTGLSGKQFRSAVAQPIANSFAGYEVAINFDDEGGKLFGELTKRNLNKPIAIFLDDTLISAPTVQSEITSGQAVITGDFNAQEATELAKQLNTGALPAPITLVDQRQVEGSLGDLSLQQALLAGFYGLIVLAVFMLAYYRLPGLIAIIALGIYALILFALFRIWPGYTLTLAGFAGAILSIGMAVDANILIFERLREELRDGKSLDLAVAQGFRRAWSSIRDSNASSLITAGILTLIGTSVVRGFAVTLALGIITSLFTAITMTRGLLLVLMRTPLAKHRWLWARAHPHAKTHVRFMENRKTFYGISIAVFLAAAAIIAFNGGLKLGLDFTGGSLVEVRFAQQLPSDDQIKGALEEVAAMPTAEAPGFLQSSVPAPEEKLVFAADRVLVTPSESAKSLILKMPQIDQATYERLLTAFSKLNGEQPVDRVRFETIGATVGEGLRANTWKALFWAIVMMVLYIAFAFRRVPAAASPWTFGTTAVIALVHDIFITVGFFSLMGIFAGWEIDTLFVSAMLTVFGFSVHDTIVVFDRLRENLILHGREKGLLEVANDSINQTLARSINTSMTTVITLSALAIFGPDSVRPFVVSMVFGIAIGTYSSIFIATPLLVDWQRYRAKRLGR